MLNAETKKLGWKSCTEASSNVITSAKVLLNLRKTSLPRGTVKLMQIGTSILTHMPNGFRYNFILNNLLKIGFTIISQFSIILLLL